MRRAIRDAANFGDLKAAVILFIAALIKAKVLTCEDFLDLAAEEILFQRKSDREAKAMFNRVLKHAQREAEFWGDLVRK
jgi:hypothetical protein